MKPPESIAPLLSRPVAVFGAGISGAGATRLLTRLRVPSQNYDEAGADFTATAAREHALVVFSPGFAPSHPWLDRARGAGAECLAELDFASLFWRGSIVAVTGTNGKTTLTEFLAHALRTAGRDAHAVGNVGRAFSAVVDELDCGRGDSIAVCEVSSFQAETLKHFRASTGIWTNFAEDHLERHPGLEAYFSAKWNLVAHTAGSTFVGASVRRHAARFQRPLGAAVCVETEDTPGDPRLEGTAFADHPQRENFLLAEAWWRAEGLEPETLYAAANRFVLGRHRLARVAVVDGVTYWNDSKATNFHAVEAALGRFAAPAVLITGGKPKGGDIAGFVHRIAPRVEHAVLIGATSREMAFHCSAFRIAHSTCATLAEAVRRAADVAPRGGNVLLSPGFASFDQFLNYEDRGEQFENLVRALGTSSGSLG